MHGYVVLMSSNKSDQICWQASEARPFNSLIKIIWLSMCMHACMRVRLPIYFDLSFILILLRKVNNNTVFIRLQHYVYITCAVLCCSLANALVVSADCIKKHSLTYLPCVCVCACVRACVRACVCEL